MRRLVVLLLILLVIPVSSQRLSAAENEWPICFDESSWADLERQVQEELRATALEAAEEAVKPHLAYEAELKAKLDADSRTILFWQITTGVSAGMAVFFAVLLAVGSLVPPMP
ncbi:hypothetical protein [Acidithiobacillus sp.]|uniref:hypothetical protein n=1 Tax=Acidithiobacillus sp. TaxID=1872118 RepID=UPI00258809CA|nr:hypothetical protein [Acidithiobacillus sp.]MDD5375742.1 hypothetical protein [Acidithiobacillus sp.]